MILREKKLNYLHSIFPRIYIFASHSIKPLKRLFYLVFTFILLVTASNIFAQRVSLPERNPFKLTFRGGAMSNNGDLSAMLNSKTILDDHYKINLNYAAIGEAELAVDLFRFRGAGIGMQASVMYAHPELRAEHKGKFERIALTQLQIVRMNLSVSFNGSDPYTMFELPYHSNKEAVLGVAGMIIRTDQTQLTPYAKDSLRIKSLKGDYCQALGVTFGWNWRLGESGWVFGLNGAVMFVINKSYLYKVETEADGDYTSDKLLFAPRILTAGFGYHF